MTATLVLTRGLPSTGKSTFAREHLPDFDHWEADPFYANADGEFIFDARSAELAHTQCQHGVERSLVGGRNVVVANTNIYKTSLKPYFALALKHGANVMIVECPEELSVNENVPAWKRKKLRSAYKSFAWMTPHIPVVDVACFSAGATQADVIRYAKPVPPAFLNNTALVIDGKPLSVRKGIQTVITALRERLPGSIALHACEHGYFHQHALQVGFEHNGYALTVTFRRENFGGAYVWEVRGMTISDVCEERNNPPPAPSRPQRLDAPRLTKKERLKIGRRARQRLRKRRKSLLNARYNEYRNTFASFDWLAPRYTPYWHCDVKTPITLSADAELQPTPPANSISWAEGATFDSIIDTLAGVISSLSPILDDEYRHCLKRNNDAWRARHLGVRLG